MAIADVIDLLVCPQCGARLALATGCRSARCCAGHAFDLGRSGYLNLLSGRPPKNADTAAMVGARDRFLLRDHYRPIVEALLAAVAGPGGTDRCLLDVGAGTGYYSELLLAALPDARAVALDVSVAAARRAARSGARLGAVVADTWRGIPMTEGTAAVVLNVFAPRNATEFHRVLARSGRLVMVTPQSDHLTEIRSTLGLLEIQPGKQQRLISSLGGYFELQGVETVRFPMELDADALYDLIAMGPNAFHLRENELTDRVRMIDVPLAVTAAVVVSRWRPRR
jgi:23S rRNA (guanine745-N1)-methyltransferase